MALTINDNTGDKVIHISSTPTGVETIFADRRFIALIVWYKPTTAGHDLYILNGTDKPWLGFTTGTNNKSEIPLPVGRYIGGMKISQLDSGELFIHYDL